MADPEKAKFKGSPSIYFSTKTNMPKNPEEIIIKIPKYPANLRGRRLFEINDEIASLISFGVEYPGFPEFLGFAVK